MDKKIIGLILIIAGVAAVCTGVFFITHKNKKENSQDNTTSINNGGNTMNKDAKTIIVYYSAQNHTKNIATKIAQNLGADIYEIVPEQIYTEDDLNWNDSDSRVSREHDDASLREIVLKSTEVPNWSEYDTVVLGYPIWWGIAAWPTDTFVKNVDWNGKTVLPFCTSHSSSIGESDVLLKTEAKGGNWQDGFRFSQDASDEDIKTWTDSLK